MRIWVCHAQSGEKMRLRWWRDVLILSQPKQYVTTARRVNIGLYRFVRLGNGVNTGLETVVRECRLTRVLVIDFVVKLL